MMELGAAIDVYRNDAISVNEVEKYDKIVISPGPCTPNEAGNTLDIIKRYSGVKPIFGVCLGHQAIAQVFGCQIIKTEPSHGKVCRVSHQNDEMFAGVPKCFDATRYHSLSVDSSSMSDEIQITAWSGDIIMGIKHKSHNIFGVQFHPESIMSEHGHLILQNFLRVPHG